jgi:glycosyltransferase involved in cell wall biosynthesis
MTVGLVLHPYGEKHAAGLGRSIFSLAKEIIEQNPQTHYVIFLKGFDTPDPVFETSNFEVKRIKSSLFWLDKGLPNDGSVDVFLFFTPVMPVWKKLQKTIVMVHDLGHLHTQPRNMRQRFSRILIRFIQRRTLRRATHIVAISEYTKSEVEHFVPEATSKISVIYNGFNQVCALGEDTVSVQKPFFLFVGVVKKRKNPLRVLQAFEIFKKETGLPYTLVFAGRADSKSFVNMVTQSPYAKDIILLGYVSEPSLCWLYRNTKAFVFPSLLEGFGMPILEAMSVGAPVITSNIDAMKEVAGEAALLVNPMEPREIAGAMKEIMSDKELRDSLITKGFQRATDFSWQKAGKEYSVLLGGLVKKEK